MQVDLLREEDERAYEEFVNNASDSKIYHTLEWKRAIKGAYGYEPCYVIATEEDSIKGILPLFEVGSPIFGRRLVSIPFSHWVNILYGGDVAVLEKLLEFAKDLTRARGCDYLQIKHGGVLPDLFGLRESRHFYNSVLDLSRPIDEIWKAFDGGSVRWGINRAKRSDLEIEGGSTLEDYRKFYRLEIETRKAQGVPPYPFRFFRCLHDYLGTSGKARLHLAYLGGVCIAGIIVLCHGNLAIYGYSACLKKREYLRTQPNNLLLWTAIEELHDEGYQEFSFGITPPSNEGLLKFKTRWGTKDYKIPYYYFLNKVEEIPIVDRTSRKMRAANGILRRLPIPVLERVGPFLLKQVG